MKIIEETRRKDASCRLLLVAIHARYIHAGPAPFCLAAGVHAYAATAADILILESTVNEDEEELFRAICDSAADLVAFSVYIWNAERVLRVARRVRRAMPGVRIVLGGPEVSYRAEELLTGEGAVDFILSGEGELPFAALVDALFGNGDLAAVPGLTRRTAAGIAVGQPYEGEGDPPDPYTETYLAELQGRIAYVESSRGCPFHCTFCLSGRREALRFFDEDRLIADIVRIASHGTRTIKLVDRTFNADGDRALRILERLEQLYGDQLPLGTTVHAEVAGACFREEDFAILARLPRGMVQFEMGVQTLHPQAVVAMGRTMRIQEKTLKAAQRLLAGNNIHLHLDLIAGLEGETPDSFADAYDRLMLLFPHMLQVGFLKRLYGAPLSEDGRDAYAVFSHRPPYQVLYTDTFPADALAHWERLEQIHDRIYNSGRFAFTYRLLLQGRTPYRLLCLLEEKLPGVSGSLDQLTDALYRAACALCPDAGLVRQTLIADRLAGVRYGKLSPGLRNPTAGHGPWHTLLDTCIPLPAGVRRTSVDLGDAVLFADYGEPDPVSGRYAVYRIPKEALRQGDGTFCRIYECGRDYTAFLSDSPT